MKSCAGADGALDMNLAGVFLDDAVGNGEAQASAAAVAGPGRGFGGEERIVDALEVLGSDAGAGVGDQRAYEACAHSAAWPRAGCRRRAWLPWRSAAD